MTKELLKELAKDINNLQKRLQHIEALEQGGGGGGGLVIAVKQAVFTGAQIEADMAWDDWFDIEDLEIAHTLNDQNNKLLLMASVYVSAIAAGGGIRFRAGSTTVGAGAQSNREPASGVAGASTAAALSRLLNLTANFIYAPNSASAVVYKVQATHNREADQDRTVYINTHDEENTFSKAPISTFTLIELEG